MKPSKLRLLCAALLLLIGLLFWQLPVGLEFLGLIFLGLCGLLAVWDILLRLKPKAPRLCAGLLIGLSVLCGVGIVGAAVTEGFIIANSGIDDDPQNDYVIVLGAAVKGKVPSRSLRERLNAALDYLRLYPESVCIVSGGQGGGEDISEAECMTQYLLDNGVPAERIRQENQATNTCENIRYSLALIERETGSKPESVTVISSGYHMLRAKLECRSHGVEPKGYSCPTPNLAYRINYYLREIPGVWYQLLRES